MGAGVAGFVVVAGFLAIGLIGVPLFRYFLGLAIALGAGIAFGLYLARRWRRSRSAIITIALKKQHLLTYNVLCT